MECSRLGVQDHIFRIGFQQLRGDLPSLVGDLAGRIVNCRAAELERPRSECAGAFCHLVGVALDDFNVVYVHAELVGGDHGEGRGVALAVRERPRENLRLAFGRDAHTGELGASRGRPACYLHISRHADAELFAVASLAA